MDKVANRHAALCNDGRIFLHHTFELLPEIKQIPKDTITTIDGQFTWVNIKKPKKYSENDPGKYSIEMIIPKTDPEIMNLWNIIHAVAKTNFGELGNWAMTTGFPIKNGDEYVYKERGDHYAGHWVIAAVNKEKPSNFDPATHLIQNANDVYVGCKGRVRLKVWAYNPEVSDVKGVTFTLKAAMRTEE